MYYGKTFYIHRRSNVYIPYRFRLYRRKCLCGILLCGSGGNLRLSFYKEQKLLLKKAYALLCGTSAFIISFYSFYNNRISAGNQYDIGNRSQSLGKALRR